MKIATALYPITWHDDFSAFAAKSAAWVKDAADQGADLLVFPEYAGVEAALLGAPDPAQADRDWVQHAAPASTGTMALWSELARTQKVHIIAGSGPSATDQGPVNRVRLFAPDGQAGHQDKLVLTPWERDNTSLCPGQGLHLFETSLGRIGILICYDAEFPDLARRLQPDILVIPACTDTPAGAARLRISARARALENQCITVLSSTTGPVPACTLIDKNHGVAGVYGPPDHGFPDTGILAERPMNTPGWCVATVDLAALGAARTAAAAPLRTDTDKALKAPDQPHIVHLKP